MQYKIKNMLQFSLANCAEFLFSVYHSVLTGLHVNILTMAQTVTLIVNSDSLHVVVDLQLNAYVLLLCMFFVFY